MAVNVDLLTSSSLNNIGTNFQRVKEALQDAVSRAGGLPNHMNADFDLNSNDVLNGGLAEFSRIILDGAELSQFGPRGWTPVYGAEEYNGTIIMKLVDYTGGEGPKPTEFIGQYIGADGYVVSPDDAINFGSTGVTDGNKGDIIVTGGGANWRLSREFDTVALLLADTNMSYTTGDEIVSAGQVVEAQGSRFEVAGSAVLDAHLTTAGGVKLYELGPSFSCIQRLLRSSGSIRSQSVTVRAYYSDNDVGGGTFYWDPTRLKSEHNGGTIISPTVPWAGTRATVLNFLAKVGETNPSGTGCWVRKDYMILNVEDFGAHPDLPDNQKPFQAALYHGRFGIVGQGYGLKSYYVYNTRKLLIYSHTTFAGFSAFNHQIKHVQPGFENLIEPGRIVPGDLSERLRNVEIYGHTFYGTEVAGEKRGACIFIQSSHGNKIHNNEIAHFSQAIRFNNGAYFQYNESYFNIIEQNQITECTVAFQLQGATNRNTFISNSIFVCGTAYDFYGSVSETNTFISENVEGCTSWAAWDESGTVYSQTWLNLTFENGSDGVVGTFRDPGRQWFGNLALIGTNVNWLVAPGKSRSTYSGTSASSPGLAASPIGYSINEKFNNSTAVTTASTTNTYSADGGGVTHGPFSYPGALVGDTVIVTTTANPNGLVIGGWVSGTGQVSIQVNNPYSGSRSLTTQFIIEVHGKKSTT